MPSTTPWRSRAACAHEDPDLFFPAGRTFESETRTRLALAVCRTCPVARECLAHALRLGVDDGIWGGMTPDARRATARRAG